MVNWTIVFIAVIAGFTLCSVTGSITDAISRKSSDNE